MSAALEMITPVYPFSLTADPVLQAQEMAPLLRAEGPKIEALGQLTPAVVEALHANGLYRILLPRQLNGYGAGLATFAKVLEALAAVDASTAWCVGQCNGCSMAAAYVEPAIAAEIWGSTTLPSLLRVLTGSCRPRPTRGGIESPLVC